MHCNFHLTFLCLIFNIWEFNLFISVFSDCLKFGSCLTLHERARLTTRYEIWKSVLRVQSWWRATRRIHAQVNLKAVKNCHARPMATRSVIDTSRRGRPFKSSDQETVQAFQNIYMSPKNLNSTNSKGKWALLSYITNCAQERCMEAAPLLLTFHWRLQHSHGFWYEHWSDFFKNVFWNDEAVFHNSGFENCHSNHYCAEEDHFVTPSPQKNAEYAQNTGVVWDIFVKDCGSIHSSRYHQYWKKSYHAGRRNLASY